MKKHLVFVFALLLVLLSCGSAFAVEISGNSPPTINGALPYYTSKTKIYEYVYTAERFKQEVMVRSSFVFMGNHSLLLRQLQLL